MIPTSAALPSGSRRLRRLVAPAIARAGATPGADRYRKHFPASAHLWLLVLHGLGAAPSLRQGFAVLSAVPDLFARLGLRQGLSFSQLARSTSSRPGACFEALLADLVAQARRTVVPDASWRAMRHVLLLDSTFLPLSLALSPWCRTGGAEPGVRLQAGLELARALPRHLDLTRLATNDRAALAALDLTPWRGWTVLVDLGYYGHRQFRRLHGAGVSFLSRLHPQASYRVTAGRVVATRPTPEGDVVLSDQTVTLGSPNNRAGAVLPGLRLIRSRNRRGREQAFVTDRFDLTAWELVRLYHYRWQIELFFRFVKRQLGMLAVLGRSRAAVWVTVLVGMVVAVLGLLLDAGRPPGVSRVAWLRGLGQTLLFALPSG